jgi:hypothetical protein
MFRQYLAASMLAAFLSFAPVSLTAARADEVSHRQAAEELMIVSGSEKNFDKGFMVGFNSMMKDNPPEMQKVGLDFAAKYLSWNSVKEDLIKLHIENFTEQELRDITAFYRTPTGQKSITILPTLFAKGMEIIQSRIADHKDELMTNLAAAKKEIDERKAREAEVKQKNSDAAPAKGTP